MSFRDSASFLPVRAYFITTTRRKFHEKNRFRMSKQFEAEIGVETILTVCYSKNDSPIKMKLRKEIAMETFVGNLGLFL